MLRSWKSAFAALGLCTGCSRQPRPSNLSQTASAGFTGEFIQALTKADKDVTITQEADLALKVKTGDDHEIQVFPDNAFAACRQDPSSKSATIQKYVESTLETLRHRMAEIDRTRIVPIIKDRAWLAEVQ